jgi:TPR repeat protein
MITVDDSSARPIAAVERAVIDPALARAAYRMAMTCAEPGEAIRWLCIAAARGSAQAMLLLGNAYRTGTGVAQSDARARAWYQRAAAHALPAAVAKLAAAHGSGALDLAPDGDEARRAELAAARVVARAAP